MPHSVASHRCGEKQKQHRKKHTSLCETLQLFRLCIDRYYYFFSLPLLLSSFTARSLGFCIEILHFIHSLCVFGEPKSIHLLGGKKNINKSVANIVANSFDSSTKTIACVYRLSVSILVHFFDFQFFFSSEV